MSFLEWFLSSALFVIYITAVFTVAGILQERALDSWHSGNFLPDLLVDRCGTAADGKGYAQGVTDDIRMSKCC